MGYRQPSGTISLYSGVNLNPDYTDTLFVQTEQQALSQIAPYLTATYEPESYTRYADGIVRVNSVADALATVNYMTFANRNANSGNNKTYFCFVTSIQYINERCTEIRFEIDDFMTWFPHLTLGECFVEREIVADDTIGKNIVPENLEIGELIEGAVSTQCFDTDLRKTLILMCSSTLEDGSRPEQQPEDGSYYLSYNGYPSGLIYRTFSDEASFQRVLKDFNDNGYIENVISIQMIPTFLWVTMGAPYSTHVWTDLPKNLNFEGYTPKNNKLYTFPYTRLVISNLTGETAEFHYEDFNTDNIQFMAIGVIYGTPSMMIVPLGYKRGVGRQQDYGIMLSNFTQAPCYNDTYRAYLAQNKNAIISSTVGSVLGGIASIAVGAALAPETGGLSLGGALAVSGGALSIGAGVASSVAKISDAQALPRTVTGLTQADAINLVSDNVNFEARNYCIKAEMAKVIDDYFSAFGYAVHRVKKPDISSRPTWNYVQTKGCIIKGSCPAEARAAICRAFDRGIRFWKQHDYIGDYSQMN